MTEAVPKIEGHAAFYTHLKNGHVDKAQIIGLENDRFVEKILLGRKFYEAPIITSRICGICPTIHNVTATRAIENACGITASSQTKKLRQLMLAAQMIQSHSLHLYLLVLPDFVGASSSFELQKSHPELFKNAIVLKKFADKVLEVIGGRAVHPITSVPGGFKAYPSKANLLSLLPLLESAEEKAVETLQLFASFKYPEIERAMIYSALHNDRSYAFYEGEIWTTKGNIFEPDQYKKYIYEELKPYTRAKFGTLRGDEMMVGAISRINLGYDHLHEKTKKLTADLSFPFKNPFQNIISQAIENHHFVITAKELIEEFIKNGTEKEHLRPPKNFSSGTAACEAPRGTLFHFYELNDRGEIIKCDIITPTVQSLPSLEKDLKIIEPLLAGKTKDEQNIVIEMLIRAYDPCITCATH